MPHLDLGSIRLHWLDGGAFRLDGATVFGPVPRTVWSTLIAPDEENLVPLAAWVILVESPDGVGLIEAGLGHHLSERQKRLFAVERDGALEAGMEALGIRAPDIQWLVLTHLHFDHAAGVVSRDGAGNLAPAFPNARHVVQRREVEAARDPEQRMPQAFDPEGFEILVRAGLVDQVDGDAAIGRGVRVFLTGGHTRGHQGVLLEGSDGNLVHLGDLLPTRHHLNPRWVSAVDDYPLDSIAAKKAALARVAESEAWLAVSHDQHVLALRLRTDRSVGDELRSI